MWNFSSNKSLYCNNALPLNIEFCLTDLSLFLQTLVDFFLSLGSMPVKPNRSWLKSFCHTLISLILLTPPCVTWTHSKPMFLQKLLAAMSLPHLKAMVFAPPIEPKSSSRLHKPAPYQLPLRSYSMQAWCIFKGRSNLIDPWYKYPAWALFTNARSIL